MTTAFEAITTKQAWHASAPLARHKAAMIDATGKFAHADGTGQFIGIVQYGAEKAGDMATVVKGTFPAIGSEPITEGAKVTIDSDNPGEFKLAAASDVVYGVALSAATAGDLFALAIADVPAPQVI